MMRLNLIRLLCVSALALRLLPEGAHAAAGPADASLSSWSPPVLTMSRSDVLAGTHDDLIGGMHALLSEIASSGSEARNDTSKKYNDDDAS